MLAPKATKSGAQKEECCTEECGGAQRRKGGRGEGGGRAAAVHREGGGRAAAVHRDVVHDESGIRRLVTDAEALRDSYFPGFKDIMLSTAHTGNSLCSGCFPPGLAFSSSHPTQIGFCRTRDVLVLVWVSVCPGAWAEGAGRASVG